MKKIPDSMTIGEAKKLGRHGDEALVHLNKAEVDLLEGMTYGHGLTINPQTGEKEAFLPFLLSMLPALFPGIGAALGGATGLSMLANPMILGAIGSGLGTAIETGDVGKGLMAGLGGAALGGLGGQLLGGAAGGAAGEAAKGVAGKLAANGGANLAANMGTGIANGSTMAASFAPNAVQSMNGVVPLTNMGQAMAPYGIMQAGLTSLPGTYLASQEAMKYHETDADKRKKDRIERAQHENFLAPRQVMTAPDGYRHGFDEEFSFFNPPGTMTPVTTDRQYAGGGLIEALTPFSPFLTLMNGGGNGSPFGLMGLMDYNKPGTPESRAKEEEDRRRGYVAKYATGGLVPQINPGQAPMRPMMPVPMGLAGKTWGQPQINPGIGVWGGLQRPMPQAPTAPPVLPGRGAGGGGPAPVDPVIGSGDYLEPLRNPSTRYQMRDRPMSRSISSYAGGGIVPGYAGGGLIEGPGDGTSDSIPALINGREPAEISDGEFIIPAAAVSALGNGSTKAGAAKLQKMVEQLIS